MKPCMLAVITVVGALTTTSARAACEDPFVWEEPGARIEISLAWGRGYVSIEAADQVTEVGREGSRGRLYSHFRTDGTRLANEAFWEPGSVSVSLTAPAVASSSYSRFENRVFSGPRRVLSDRDPTFDFFGVAPNDRVEVWTHRRDASEGRTGGSWMLDNLLGHGEARVEYWGGRDRAGLAKRAEARFEWGQIDRLVDRARVHFAGCPTA